MSAGVPLASWKTQMFESVLGFLPDWVQITVLALVVLAVVAGWVLKIRRNMVHRRALRAMAAARRPESGADFLGPYAPQRDSDDGRLGVHAPEPAADARRPSGADFLGAYAPPRGSDDRA
ncbi:hypothetical protein [Streptomyces sp. OP7]|uniref:hypothetical protein n=1 Tax=Streptomyces sp. OP7 TaxID=3142462 RepID=UPI0032E8B57A